MWTSSTPTSHRLANRRTHYRPLERIHRKIAKVEEKIAEAEGGSQPDPRLFAQEHPGLRALQDRKRRLEHVVKLLEGELRGK